MSKLQRTSKVSVEEERISLSKIIRYGAIPKKLIGTPTLESSKLFPFSSSKKISNFIVVKQTSAIIVAKAKRRSYVYYPRKHYEFSITENVISFGYNFLMITVTIIGLADMLRIYFFPSIFTHSNSNFL